MILSAKDRFSIIQDDPIVYRNAILEFWKEYLPGAPMARFDWLNHGNPAGQAIWLFAIANKTNELVSTLSIMPRNIRILDKEFRAGIVGDFMVAKEYRVFGPTLLLMKTVVKGHQGLGFDFIYTIPNAQSMAVALRSGFARVGNLKRFTKILNPGYKLKGRMPSLLSSVLAPSSNIVYKILSWSTYRTPRLDCKKYDGQTDLDLPCTVDQTDFPYIVGDRSPAYMQWRYFLNPLYQCKIFEYTAKDTNLSLGRVVFTVLDDIVHMLDIVFDRTESVKPIMSRFLRDMRKEGYGAVSVRMLEGNPLQERFETLGFYMREETAPLLFVGKPSILPSDWLFFDGDRNI